MDDPVGHRQPRHRIGVRRASRRRRDRRDAVGEVRDHLGQHGEEPAVHLQSGRQSDHARDDARGARRGDGREAQAPGDCGQDSRRVGRTATRSAASASLSGGREHDAGAGGAEGDRAGWQVRRPRAARGHQRHDQGLGHGAGRSGLDGRRARQLRTRRDVEVVRGRIRRSRSRCRDRALQVARLPGRRRRRHGHPSA